MRQPGPVDYLLLLFLCLAWASIYPLVKVAEHDFEPIALMAVRALTASVCMLLVALFMRKSLRVSRAQHVLLVELSVLNVSLIWVAISVAEVHLSSGLTALLTALIPIGTFVLNAFVLRTERAETRRILGLFVALVGLVLVLDPSRIASRGLDVTGLLLMMTGCLGYAAGGLLASHRAHELDPVVTTVWSLLYATLELVVLSFLLERPLETHPTQDSVLAVVAAGCVATALPNLIYYKLVREVGPQFASLFGYGLPLFGVLLGVVLMHERVTVWLVPGVVLILAGVALVRSNAGSARAEATGPSSAPRG
jgi:drug/metabolite transporter (DMT)-like permease